MFPFSVVNVIRTNYVGVAVLKDKYHYLLKPYVYLFNPLSQLSLYLILTTYDKYFPLKSIFVILFYNLIFLRDGVNSHLKI